MIPHRYLTARDQIVEGGRKQRACIDIVLQRDDEIDIVGLLLCGNVATIQHKRKNPSCLSYLFKVTGQLLKQGHPTTCPAEITEALFYFVESTVVYTLW